MASQSAPKDKNTQPNFQWTPEMIDHLIISLKDYKAEMDYKNVDFNSDVVAMYSKLRECMALAFDTECFGPIDIPVQEESDSVLSKEEEKIFQAQVALAKSQIKKGYNRIKEKIRQIRKAYNKAVTNGTRSGSGKIVQEHYDELAQIWKGSPATDKLGFGISSNASLNTSGTSSSSSAPGTPSDDPLDTSQEHIEEEPSLDDDSDADDDENDAGMNGNVICKFSLIILHVYSFMVAAAWQALWVGGMGTVLWGHTPLHLLRVWN